MDEGNEMSRHSVTFKKRALERLLAPENASVEVVAQQIGVQPSTLSRWRDETLSRPARGRAGTAAARFDAVLSTAPMDEASKSAWCRAQGVYPQDLEGWRQSATAALAEPMAKAVSPKQSQQDKQRIKELERELLRKERALAETAALLVLSKKVAAIFNKGEAE